MIDTKSVRALAERLEAGDLAEGDGEVDMLRQCADRIDALEGQALSSIEREEYFALKEDAARGRYIIEALSQSALQYYHLEAQSVEYITDEIDRARKGTT